MADLRVTSFNVNQHSSVAHQQSGLLDRMAVSDRMLLQETVNVDLAAFVADPKTVAVAGVWGVFQVRDGDSDGHANTAVMWRVSAGVPTDTTCVPVGDAKDTRARFLAGALFAEGWDWSAHVFPKRDTRDIAAELHAIGAWVKAHPNQHAGGLDKNQASVRAMQVATGLKWHGINIDGFLTNRPLKALAEFPKGFSDHPGVHALIGKTEDKPVKHTRLQRLRAALRRALAHFNKAGKKRKAVRAKAALEALRPPGGKPAEKPDPIVEGFPAIAAARTQSHNGPQFGVNECRLQCRIALGKPSVGDFDGDGDADAEDAWKAAKLKHPGDRKPPRGKGVFWGGGSHDNGHEAISAGEFGGVWHIWSTDILRPGFFDFVPLSMIEEKWGLTYLGWAEDQ